MSNFHLLRDLPSHDGRAQHVREYAEQKRVLPEWYERQWRTVFSSNLSPLGYESIIVIGRLLVAEEKEGTVYFTIEVQDYDPIGSQPLVATFTGPFWHFSQVEDRKTDVSEKKES